MTLEAKGRGRSPAQEQPPTSYRQEAAMQVPLTAPSPVCKTSGTRTPWARQASVESETGGTVRVPGLQGHRPDAQPLGGREGGVQCIFLVTHGAV